MSNGVDLESRLTATLHRHADRLDAPQWPDADELRRRPAAIGRRHGQPARHAQVAWMAVAAVGVVALLATGLAVAIRRAPSVRTASSSTSTPSPDDALADALASVPDPVVAAAGTPTTEGVVALHQPTLTQDGRPEVLFVGAEYCPYCAAMRWSLAVALDRFGHLSDLRAIASSNNDVLPDTASFSFHGSTYASDSIAFVGREIMTDTPQKVSAGAGYTPLDVLTPAEQQVEQQVDPQGTIPLIDIGGGYAIIGSSFDPAVLAGRSSAQIAQDLVDPTSAATRAIVAQANLISAAICSVTRQAPSAVCTDPAVVSASHLLPAR